MARKASADYVIFGRGVAFAAEARRLTDDRGVDVVDVSMGRETFEQSFLGLHTRGYEYNLREYFRRYIG
jgi:NADPH:quinone reductase-like Zn-dependent oxidoreductase